MRLLLMRHGQTHANVSGELDTAHPGVNLTDLGRAQAVAASKALSEVPLDAIYVSSRVRTHQTAAPTAQGRGLELTVLEGLEEISAGDFEMRNDHDAIAALNKELHEVRGQKETVEGAWLELSEQV